MALRRLLLYTDGGNTSDAKFNFNGNITFDCITNCVGMCIYDLCIRPPPLSPVTSPIDHNSDDMTSIDAQRREVFPTLIITIVSAVVGSFGLLTLYAYFRFRRRARRRHPPLEAAVSVGSAIDGDETGSDDSPGGEIDHHIWHIRTQGLDDSTIASITSWVYKSSDGLINSSDCSVCLGEFHDGELVRLLPKCSHAFHLPCIDMWLRSHVNCPLCRAPIVYPEVVIEPATDPVSPQTAVITVSTELEPESHAPLELQLVALPGENSSVGSEIGIDIHTSEGCSSQSSNSVLPHNNSLEEEDRLQPIRRSISIDFLSLEAVTREERAADELQEPGGRASLNREKSGSFLLKGNLFRKLPKKMERSLSSQSLQWIFPRYGRPQNSVLPL